MSGIFISFEGVEGCGKSTQIALLEQKLRTTNHDVLLTREPGGTPIADQIRRILLDSQNKDILPLTELLLYASSRAEHLGQVIRKNLKDGKIVLCDRFLDSTTAYQGYARGFDLHLIEQIHHITCQGLKPNLTLLLDCDPKQGLKRAMTRMQDKIIKEDRFEQESLDFHQKVRQGFLAIAKQESDRVKIINAERTIDEIAENIWSIVNEYLDRS